MKLCFLDLETTGFDPAKDSIIECSFVVIENDQEVAQFDQVFQPDKSEMSEFVSQLTGISFAELAAAGDQFSAASSEITQLIGDAVIVGHNIDFDINFLVANGVPIGHNSKLDTHDIARIILPHEESYALEILAPKYGCQHANAHRAMSDVLACKDFWDILSKKFDQLPAEFLSQAIPLLDQHPDWWAARFFRASQGVPDLPGSREKTTRDAAVSEGFKWEKELSVLNVSRPDYQRTAKLTYLAQQTALHTPVLLITDTPDRYPDFPVLPTPEVLLSPEKLAAALQAGFPSEKLVFFLKVLHRKTLGCRGVKHFDLFFTERVWWTELTSEHESPAYQTILKEKAQHPVLTLTPSAYLKLGTTDALKSKKLIIESAETLSQQLLFSPVIRWEWQPLLDHADENLAQQTQFTIARICRDFLEKKLGYELGPFPTKLPFDNRDGLQEFCQELLPHLDEPSREAWEKIFTQEIPSSFSWLEYFPKSGSLTFCHWQAEAWRAQKNQLSQVPQIALATGQELELGFINTFWTATPAQNLATQSDLPTFDFSLASMSIKSPEFNDFTAEQIIKLVGQTTGNIAVNFSSLEALRQVCEKLKGQLDSDSFFVSGQNFAGGDGKLFGLIESHKHKRLIIGYTSLDKPKLATLGFEALVLTKIPFAPPHPLLQHFETVMKQNGDSFWDAWVIPQLRCRLAQRIVAVGPVEKIYTLDTRFNAPWGKSLQQGLTQES